MFKDLIIGGCAGVISRTCTAPLELYKIQSQNKYFKESNIKNVLKNEGFRYLWKGNLTNCIRAFPQFGISYSVYAFSKNNLFYFLENKNYKNFYSGGVAGFVSMSIIYPLETIRTRLSLQMNKSHYNSISSAFSVTSNVSDTYAIRIIAPIESHSSKSLIDEAIVTAVSNSNSSDNSLIKSCLFIL